MILSQGSFGFALALALAWSLCCTTDRLCAEENWRGVVETYCSGCHDADTAKGDLDLNSLLDKPIADHRDEWEKVVRMLSARRMPPPGKKSPRPALADQTTSQLAKRLDQLAVSDPRPGRPDSIRRLNRTEYQNAIRDLLDLRVDARELLPVDPSSHGFDNVTVSDLSPARMERYLNAARKISQLAVGTNSHSPEARIIRVKPDLTQEKHLDGLPLGTRGGVVFDHLFPRSGKYRFRIRLARDRNEKVEGLRGPHELIILLDRKQVASFIVNPPPNPKDHTKVDANLSVEIPVAAGQQKVGVTFAAKTRPVGETLRQPYESQFNFHRHPRNSPAVFQVSVTGPFGDHRSGPSPSRQRIFGAAKASRDPASVLRPLLRRAWRRPVSDDDLAGIIEFYERVRSDGGSLEEGIEAALSAILVSRDFLFRVERDPVGLPPGSAYPLTDIELASRLSFFLWRSIPDEELLALAEEKNLGTDDELDRQARRMLRSPKAAVLANDFAGQWLYLRNLDSVAPDGRLYPDFDENLRRAMRRETELHLARLIKEDRPITDLIRSKTTFLNERLAKHYEIANIYGSHFREVPLSPESRRGGVLRHGSILTVTSYSNRTSPVLRGHWILKNLLGTPPPPPPPDVPALDDNDVPADLPIRERLALHREKSACASCHDIIDPWGFALENYDAIGRWRWSDNGALIEESFQIPGQDRFSGVDGLEEALLRRPERFAANLAEKLLIYATGRGLEPSDGPAIRQIVRAAQKEDYRFVEFVAAIVQSAPFRQRSLPSVKQNVD